ncbi:MAG TPA: SusD/RagB family nutrient-binding outer membrane lipoprotein, partial [Chitinophagaceae bacterium]|nr:SusD/RagB family nutrient-binding outer membrane lipoprotein [Chitinophagaceae bacterium]
VGDIPMSQALDPNNTTPAYDNQHDVYKNCLALLDTANTLIANLGTAGASSTVAGDIYGRTQLQWQKIINAYRLRVLISLSKRASDNADLNVQAQFATIVNNPSQYPIMASNSDNLIYTYTAVTLYPPNRSGNAPYNNCENINTTFMNLLVPNNDPRIYTLTSPATALIAGGKSLSDSSAYIGINNNQTQASFVTFTGDGLHSCLNYNRYMSSASGANAEPYIIIGYPEMCFNIAEAINRGWVTGTTATWYKNGILAHMGLLGLSDGKSITISNYDGSKTLGTVMVNVTNFINNANIVYAGDNATGLTQILTQKYIAFFMNSGYESYYNWRRTGVPAFNQGGAGIGTPSLTIPYRWQYPQNEISYNSTNYNAALQAQGFTSDDLNAKIWLIK